MKLNINFLALFFVLLGLQSHAQHTITGTFPPMAGQQVKLVGFQGFDIYTIDQASVNQEGVFQLSFADKDFGMGYLAAADNKAFFVILAPEVLKMEGELLSMPETVIITSGTQNQIFGRYASEQPRREQALSAWGYLEKIYTLDSLFLIHAPPRNAIEVEKVRIKTEDSLFLHGLDQQSYVRWFLPTRKLVSSVSVIAQYRTEEIPETVESFRKLDYSDPRLYKSGLFKDAIESHFWLLENSGRSLDSVYIEMNLSIDRMFEQLLKDERRMNEVADYLFSLLERHSLFGASEYLALKLLNQVGCSVDDNLAKQLESYRAMKKGNIAPDFGITGDRFAPGYNAPGNIPGKLSDLKTEYVAVVFGASWCPKCVEDLSSMAKVYAKWRSHGVEVVFVSLDVDLKAFTDFAGQFPFISMCDYGKWNSPVVTAYYVSGTPTLYLLNNKREILLRPNSFNQLDSWVDWFLVKGNR
jgi:thiol-disulfide isomerase/thioredoxin